MAFAIRLTSTHQLMPGCIAALGEGWLGGPHAGYGRTAVLRFRARTSIFSACTDRFGFRIRTSLGQSFSSTCQFSTWCLAASNSYDEGGRDPAGGRLRANEPPASAFWQVR